MLRRFFFRIGAEVTSFIQRPTQVMVSFLIVLVIGLLADGTLFRLWRLQRDSKELVRRTDQLKIESEEFDQKIRLARDPNFIELKAREKFDLASEGDLIFVFSDQ